VIGNPSGVSPELHGAREESRAVSAELRQRGYAVEQSIDEDSQTILQKFCADDYRVIHIAAHGNYVERKPAESGVLIGPPGPFGPRMLTAAMFRQRGLVPDVVFLNCCHLGRLDSGLVTGPFAASVAEELIRLGVRCVVVAGWAVNDMAATRFAETFYARLLAGVTFGDAVYAARRVVWRDFPESTTWGAYQCYGEPTFSLVGRTSRASPAEFVSAAEAREAVTDVLAAASRVGKTRGSPGPAERNAAGDHWGSERLVKRLEAIERRLQPEWETDGALLNARAEAWAALDDRPRAIRLYREALRAGDSRAPVRAIEQLANQLDRYGSDVGKRLANGTDGEPSDEARGQRLEEGRQLVANLADSEATEVTDLKGLRDLCTGLAEVWLSRAEGLGETAERFGLRGGWLRRAARLEDAARVYRQGVDLVRSRSGAVPYYPGIPAVAAAWAAGPVTGDLRRDLLELLAGCRASARSEERELGKRFWTMSVSIDATLLEHLIEETTTSGAADRLAREYRILLERYGTATERRSVLNQLALLEDAARGRPALAAGGGLDPHAFLVRVRHHVGGQEAM
jgi:hypothetical protein